jgi:hypothetical protein
MKKTETFGGLIVLAIGTILAVEAWKLPYFVEDVPGPGFLPLWLAGGILIAGATIVVKALRGSVPGMQDIVWPEAWGWRQVLTMLGTLAVSLLLLSKLGFLVTTTGFMAVMIYSLGGRSWPTLILAPVAAAGILYLVFAVWLNVPLPEGIFGLPD